ncbi:MAG: hypothetical protein VKK04_11705 [Synechococcales bacterium]|nr:hypothetical protein [Synechococcales bacterium]
MTHYRLLWLVGAVAIAACQGSPPAVTPPASSEAPQSPSFPATPPSDVRGDRPTTLPDNVQIYQDESGMFALALPAGYAYQPSPQGLAFHSPDSGFRGEITYLETGDPEAGNSAVGDAEAGNSEADGAETTGSSKAEANGLPLADLEARLKQVIQADLAEVTWQGAAEQQPDGSLRLAWTGVNKDGDELDALSFIEQHHNTLFILKLYGVGETYSSYNEDARIIVGSYVVRQAPPDPQQANTSEQASPGS